MGLWYVTKYQTETGQWVNTKAGRSAFVDTFGELDRPKPPARQSFRVRDGEATVGQVTDTLTDYEAEMELNRLLKES